MSQIVVDTDVASYIFNWHSLAQQYVDALRGSDLILSFMSVAEFRMGAMSAGWGSQRRLLLERFVHGFEIFYPDNDLCTVWARIRADARACPIGLVKDQLGHASLETTSVYVHARPTDGLFKYLR